MEVHKKKGGILLYHLAFLVMLILLDSYCCGAAVLVKSNSSFRCDGRLDECLIEEDLELEFLMNPYLSRILAAENHDGVQSGNPDKQAVTCGKPNDTPQYAKCIGKGQGNKHKSVCKNAYDKGCKP